MLHAVSLLTRMMASWTNEPLKITVLFGVLKIGRGRGCADDGRRTYLETPSVSRETTANAAFATTHAPSPFDVSDFRDIDGKSVSPDGLCMECSTCVPLSPPTWVTETTRELVLRYLQRSVISAMARM